MFRFVILVFVLAYLPLSAEKAPLKLSSLVYLFEHSDAILIVTKSERGNRSSVESVLSSKGGLEVTAGDLVYIDLMRKYEHTQPVLVRGKPYLVFLDFLDAISPDPSETFVVDGELVLGSSIEKKFNKYSVVGGAHGTIPVFDLRELSEHPQIIRMKKIAPNYDPLGARMSRLAMDFDTDNGAEILVAVETVAKLYSENTPDGRINVMLGGLVSGNPATIKLIRELLVDSKFLEFDIFDNNVN